MIRLNEFNNTKKSSYKEIFRKWYKMCQGTDGCGFYGTDTVDEQLAIQNLLGLSNEDFLKEKSRKMK